MDNARGRAIKGYKSKMRSHFGLRGARISYIWRARKRASNAP